MSIRKDVDYPGRWDAATTEYPMGKPKNRTTSTSKDGSYLEKKWIQDYEAFFGALLNEVGVSPNGSVDTAESSQFFDALTSKVNGETSFATNGYQKLSSGLIIQWGVGTASPSTIEGTENTLPIAFPNAHFVSIPIHQGNDTTGTNLVVVSKTTSSVTIKSAYATSISAAYISIGY